MESLRCESPARLDRFLATQLPDLSRTTLKKHIEQGHVSVDGKVCTKPAEQLREGAEVVCTFSELPLESVAIDATDLQLPLLYEDDSCLVIDKPAGIAVHPGSGMPPDEKTILHGVRYLLEQRSLPFFQGSALVHRLDRETTGALLVAKTSNAHSELQSQFQERTVEKEYLAIVCGVPSPASALIDAPINRSTRDRTQMEVRAGDNSRDAKTTYRTIDATDDAALLSCLLHTGRTHQIRVHLRTIGHPILGDPTYATRESQECSEQHHISNLCLHAWKLGFVSPDTGKNVVVQSEIPHAFRATLQELSFLLSVI